MVDPVRLASAAKHCRRALRPSLRRRRLEQLLRGVLRGPDRAAGVCEQRGQPRSWCGDARDGTRTASAASARAQYADFRLSPATISCSRSPRSIRRAIGLTSASSISQRGAKLRGSLTTPQQMPRPCGHPMGDRSSSDRIAAACTTFTRARPMDRARARCCSRVATRSTRPTGCRTAARSLVHTTRARTRDRTYGC